MCIIIQEVHNKKKYTIPYELRALKCDLKNELIQQQLRKKRKIHMIWNPTSNLCKKQLCDFIVFDITLFSFHNNKQVFFFFIKNKQINHVSFFPIHVDSWVMKTEPKRWQMMMMTSFDLNEMWYVTHFGRVKAHTHSSLHKRK